MPARVDPTQDERLAQTPSGSSATLSLSWRDARGDHRSPIAERSVVGAAPDVDILVDVPTVSRLHAELLVRPDGLWIRDLDSKNGTYVSGIRVTEARVPLGATIHLGTTALQLSDGQPASPPELWESDAFEGMLGRSASMRRLFALIARAAKSDATVHVHGETGSGKELVAQALHSASPRARGPFVVVDCAAIPENLFEARLFGHARGAFTGAHAAHAGDIEAADGGTLFLDEVGELPLAMQPKLLRAIESRQVRPVGETRDRSVDVRFVSATHRDLRRMVNSGAFREDLYFRLAVVPLTVPPLRERVEDIPLLVERFARDKGGAALPPSLVAELSARPWLGNVRELRNFVERAEVLGAPAALSGLAATAASQAESPAASAHQPSSLAQIDGLTDAVSFEQDFRTFRDRWCEVGEREYLQRLLARHDGNVALAATEAAVDRTYIYRLMRRHGL